MNWRDLDESSDEELIGMIAAGEMAALRTLYDRHFDWLTMRLGRRCSDRNVVDEVVQDTFLAVWRGAKRFRGEGQVAAWIWGIGIRRLLDRFRRRQVLHIHYRPLPEPSAEIWTGVTEALIQSGVQVWMAGLAGVLVVILGFRRPAFDQVQVGD